MNMKTATCKAYTKSIDVAARTVEQIVSVFENVDLGGDRVKAGAFVDTLAAWKASPNTMPVYFSHQWDDPFSNIASVIEAEELVAGDVRLPDDVVVTEDGKTLRELGGLLTKYQFDPEGLNPKADQVFHLLNTRRLYQASFAYDIAPGGSKRNSDGTTDLMKLNLIEVGPTLLGMNPATTLLTASRKSAAELAKASGLSEADVQKVIDAATKSVNHTFIASAEDPSRCSFPDCGKTQGAIAHIQRLSDDTGHDLKSATWTGSIEERQSAISELATAWAMDAGVANGGLFAVHLEATFEDRAIFMVEGNNDPWNEGKTYEAGILDNEDGSFSLADPVEVVVEQSTRPKSFSSSLSILKATDLRARKAQDTAKRKDGATLPADEDEITDPANPEAGNGNGEGEGSEVESESEEEAGTEAKRFREEAELWLAASS